MAHQYDLKGFVKKFKLVREMGFIPSKRSGPTGVGHTLEQILEMKENNIALPDLGEVELKGRRANSDSMITLFTFNRKAWKVPPLEAIRKYGSYDKNGRKGLYYTLSRTPNGAGLFLHVGPEEISVRHISGEIVAVWQLAELADRFMKKIPAAVLVSAMSELRADSEWFHYTSAKLVYGTSVAILREQITIGNILVDLRLHEKPNSARNHGTGFRVREANLAQIFKNVEDLG